MIRIDSWPRAILHIDADAFFASVEQTIHPELKGRPVICGGERGIVAAASYEAKTMGVKRGVSLREVRRICPECVILPSDYETYSLFSKKMFAIVREYTPIVEEYSIDEAFADLTGLRRVYHASYAMIASMIKKQVEQELGLTVSVGLSLSKSLAKLCSKFRKPSGFVAVPGRYIHILLSRTPLKEVWGFGHNSVAYLEKMGLRTALDYAQKSEGFAKKVLGKVGLELWKEFNGEYVYKVDPQVKRTYQSIRKSKTFSPSSKDRNYVQAQLLRNLESACIKARRYDLVPAQLGIYLKYQDFSHSGVKIHLSRPSASTLEMAPMLISLFDQVFVEGSEYRATGVTLLHLQKKVPAQFGLFEDPVHIIKAEKVSSAIDEANKRFGKHSLSLAEGLFLKSRGASRSAPTYRKTHLLEGESLRRRINLPLKNIKV